MTNYEFRAVFMRFHLYFHACFDEIIKSVFSYLRRVNQRGNARIPTQHAAAAAIDRYF